MTFTPLPDTRTYLIVFFCMPIFWALVFRLYPDDSDAKYGVAAVGTIFWPITLVITALLLIYNAADKFFGYIQKEFILINKKD